MSWPWWIRVSVVPVVIATAALSASCTSMDKPMSGPGETSGPAVPTPAGSPGATQAQLGDAVRDGPLEFIVHHLRRAPTAQNPADPTRQTRAAGQYIIVALSVRNTGSIPVHFAAELQSLVADGVPVAADPSAVALLSPESAQDIPPGDAIGIEEPFDTAARAVPETVVVNDASDPLSSIAVSVRGAPIAD